MADVKIENLPIMFARDLSDEQKAEVVKEMQEYMVGADQQMIGEGRRKLVDRFVELLNSMNPERVTKLEDEIRLLQTMDKANRFRIQVYLMLIDVFQGGMQFAVMDKRAIDHKWDLAGVLGLPKPRREKVE